jgi:hypothetical protein
MEGVFMVIREIVPGFILHRLRPVLFWLEFAYSRSFPYNGYENNLTGFRGWNQEGGYYDILKQGEPYS